MSGRWFFYIIRSSAGKSVPAAENTAPLDPSLRLPSCLVLCLLPGSLPVVHPHHQASCLERAHTRAQEPSRLAVVFRIHQQRLRLVRIFFFSLKYGHMLSSATSYIVEPSSTVYSLKNILLPKSTRQPCFCTRTGSESAARFVEGSPPEGDEPGCASEADAPESGRSVR